MIGSIVGQRLRGWLGNLVLMMCSFAAMLLLCEFVLFRYIFIPDDVLHNATIDGVVRYVPDTRAVMRHPDGSQSLITINSHGWNSTKPVYTREKTPGVQRIAVVGDSYVHGGFIDVDKGFPEVLEQELVARGAKAEVLRFGIDGAPLSQYLHVIRSEVLKYKPDVVVIPIIHNDFDESYRFMHTRTGSSFMKLAEGADGRVTELPPIAFKMGMADKLRNFRTFRYLYYETNAYLKLKWLISKVYWGGSAEWNEAFISSAVDIRNLQGQEREIEKFTRYTLAQLQALSAEHGFRLLFVMDGVREAIYAGKPPQAYEIGKLNTLMAGLTRELALPFVDLHAAFAQDWKQHRTRLEFPFDWHWNELGNDIVATVIADHLRPSRPARAATAHLAR
jgi:GDSL-like Lipase/Acylhydrolase family